MHPCQHPPRVVLRGHGRNIRRRGRRADLPDQLSRGVPVGAVGLGCVRGGVRERSAARQDRSDPRPASRPARRDRDRPAGERCGDQRRFRQRRGTRADHARAAARARPHALTRGARGASRGRARGGPVHVHLHLRHHRTAEGLRAHPRQLSLDHRHDQRRWRDPGRRGHLPVPAARALVRAADPARRVRPRRHARVLRRRHQAGDPRAARGQTDVPAVGATRVREDLHDRARRHRGAAARGAASARSGRSSWG